MKKKILKITLIATAIICTTIGIKTIDKECKSTLNLILANTEALAAGEESLDCNYSRNESQCSIYVGAKGYVKLLGGTIIKAGADGYARFDGKVVCIRGGNSTCKPVECIDLYETFCR